MSDVYGGLAFFACAVIWLALGGYSFAKAVASGDLKQESMGVMFGFCLILAPFAFGFSLVSSEKKPVTKS